MKGNDNTGRAPEFAYEADAVPRQEADESKVLVSQEHLLGRKMTVELGPGESVRVPSDAPNEVTVEVPEDGDG